MKHSDGPYGENLAKGSWDVNATEAVQMWLDEKKFYNVGSNTCVEGEMCGHYTQVVWRDTTHVGCAGPSARMGGRLSHATMIPRVTMSESVLINYTLL
ncbi:UNVERIFIED_CONTAM: Pathogenesis-related protein 1A [Sesamum radiatum]|uniref:Pathogenesis-related protein 1A n=1 Tax=Sesamum radiatum TaxID=300843 RepID=A0AAW2U688_SESRA